MHIYIYTYVHTHITSHPCKCSRVIMEEGAKECRSQRQWMITRKLYLQNTEGSCTYELTGVVTLRKKDPCMSITTQIKAWSGDGGMKFQPYLRSY